MQQDPLAKMDVSAGSTRRKYDYWTVEEIKAFLNVYQIFKAEGRRVDGMEWIEFAERLKQLHNVERNNDACRHQVGVFSCLIYPDFPDLMNGIYTMMLHMQNVLIRHDNLLKDNRGF